MKNKFNLWDEVNSSSKGKLAIAIAGHIRPDGDCFGSCLGLYLYLKNRNPELVVDVYLDSIPTNFAFLNGADTVHTNCDEDKIYDVFIAMDCGDIKRLGDAAKYFESAKKTMCIDHHISNTNFADINHIVLEASSTSEIIADCIEEEWLNKDIATALYLGIIHDTGVFKHSCTTRHTMELAGRLMEQGIDFSRMIDETFYQKTYLQNQILGRCLLESILILEGECIVSTISKEVLDFYGAKSEDLDGIIDQLRITKGTQVAVLIHETKPGEYKVSMRSSKNVDVSKVAVYFGGGGHVKAAGCSMSGNVYDVINNIVKHIEAQLIEK